MTNNLSYKIYQTACQLFEKNGFDQVSMVDIAKECCLKESELYKLFGNKQDIIIFLYQCINADWQHQVNLLPKGTLEERFKMATQLKIELMAPYESFLGSIIGQLVQSHKISVTSFQTSHIRAIGLKTVENLIDGAKDSKTLKKRIKDLPSLLFMMHWGVLFLHLQTLDSNKTTETIEVMSKVIGKLNALSLLIRFLPFVNEMSSWANKITLESTKTNNRLNNEVLKVIFNHRKLVKSESSCENNSCKTCYELHDLNIDYFTSQNLPIHFILPAFPAKSPNSDKVLGKLPDLGEEIALQTLNTLCSEIKSIYSPGAHVTICSDGRIFSDLVGVTDTDITNYVEGIKTIIQDENLADIDIVNLENLMEGSSFDDLREKVIATYAEPYRDLVLRLKSNEEFKGLFNGIHRFISDDRKFLYPNTSTTKIKEESKEIALKLIQYSNAWTRFLTYVFPKSIRLSIHPYQAHSEKIGIKITKALDNWLTPWHGVIVLQKEGYVLMKKQEAEEKNAKLVYKNDKPYYYTLIDGL